jgi:signal transduction histidine kinase
LRSLYLRIWLTVVAVLALFALASSWLWQRHVEQERVRVETAAQGRAEAWADLLERSLPPASAPREEQAAALREWSQRLRLPMALDDERGERIAASEAWMRREAEAPPGVRRGLPMRLSDGRTLWLSRGGAMRRGPGMGPGMGPGPGGPMGAGAGGGPGGPFAAAEGPGRPLERPLPMGMPGLLPGGGLGIVLLLGSLFLAVALGAWPVVRRLTRRLEALKRGVQAFGAGALNHRVPEDGRDEVAEVAAAFNQTAERVQGLLRSHQSLLANASHELRSPLARLKMAVSLLDEAAPAQREALRREINTNITELDALVEEVLLASRLDASEDALRREAVALHAVLAEECSRVGAQLEPGDAGAAAAGVVQGDARLLRRAVRNLLENARRYGGGDILVQLHASAAAGPASVQVRVSDRGPGVPEAWRERIFEPFFRLPGHAEHEGGVGLGLSLVRQIAQRHGGRVRCEPREGGGSCFVLELPVQAPGPQVDGLRLSVVAM